MVCKNVNNYYTSYQWLLNGKAIPSAEKQYFNANTTGNYSIKVKNADACEDTSATTSINSLSGVSGVFPNPVQNNFKLKFTSEEIGKTIVSIVNINGSVVKTYEVTKANEEFEFEANITNQPAGIYTITAQVNSKVVYSGELIKKQH